MNIEITKEKTVAEIVTENMGADHVFSKYKIDFCCGGNLALGAVCEENNIDFDNIKKEIEAIKNIITNDSNFDNLNIEALIDYVQNNYHTYFTESIPVLLQLTSKVAQVHGEQHKEVVAVNSTFIKFSNLLIEQLETNLNDVFPSIKKIITSDKEQIETSSPNWINLKEAIQNIEKLHIKEGDFFKEIRQLTSNYTTPVNACNTYISLYRNLQKLEQKLHKYIHFEINILFPKVLKFNTNN
ncbi:MAG: DUF542 domain-containing protein [Flavobacteriaceae bacterium]|nr:DUF542 domain-containing protein [Flavobacteriaceae bacterium]